MFQIWQKAHFASSFFTKRTSFAPGRWRHPTQTDKCSDLSVVRSKQIDSIRFSCLYAAHRWRCPEAIEEIDRYVLRALLIQEFQNHWF